MTQKSLNIVVVEDDVHDYELLCHVFEKFKFSFEKTWLKDGGEVISYLEKLGSLDMKMSRKYIFFLDINLPKINGLELIKKIKNYPVTRKSLVVMLSGSGEKNDLDLAKENGSDFYLVKPFGRQEVVEFSEKINSIFRNLK